MPRTERPCDAPCRVPITVVTVVRHRPLYQALVRNNRFLAGARFVLCDNTVQNETIAKRYNDFLRDEPPPSAAGWYVFCHEDFEFLEDVSSRLKSLPQDRLYGIAGRTARKDYRGFYVTAEEDSGVRRFEGAPYGRPRAVSTLDCACLIVHAALLQKCPLRFDEALSFDLYVEDFCIQAREKHGVRSFVLPLRCAHCSQGRITPRYAQQEAYLKQKWTHLSQDYWTTCGTYFGAHPRRRSWPYRIRKSLPIRFETQPSGRLAAVLFNRPISLWRQYSLRQWMRDSAKPTDEEGRLIRRENA